MKKETVNSKIRVIKYILPIVIIAVVCVAVVSQVGDDKTKKAGFSVSREDSDGETGVTENDGEAAEGETASDGAEAEGEAGSEGEASNTTVKPTVPAGEDYDYDGPQYLNFYVDANGSRNKIKSYTSEWVSGSKIASLLVFASDEDYISDDTYSVVWKSYWENSENAYDYKIGYEFIFTTDSAKVDTVITKPSDVDAIKDYVELYMYDDINIAPNTWYSHLTDAEVTDDSYMSSIKVVAGIRVDEVREMTMKAFIYKNESDFDADGKYTGSMIVTCPLYEQE